MFSSRFDYLLLACISSSVETWINTRPSPALDEYSYEFRTAAGVLPCFVRSCVLYMLTFLDNFSLRHSKSIHHGDLTFRPKPHSSNASPTGPTFPTYKSTLTRLLHHNMPCPCNCALCSFCRRAYVHTSIYNTKAMVGRL